MKYAAEIAVLKKQAAAYREASLDLVTVDHIRARQLLREAEALETRVVLLKAAGLSGTYQPFRGTSYEGFKRHRPRAESWGERGNDKINQGV